MAKTVKKSVKLKAIPNSAGTYINSAFEKAMKAESKYKSAKGSAKKKK